MVRCGTVETYVAGPSRRNVNASTKVQNRPLSPSPCPLEMCPITALLTVYATVEQKKTMLAPELSRLTGAPSKCVCSVGPLKENAIVEDVISARHETMHGTLANRKGR